jgi:hypothetical protein
VKKPQHDEAAVARAIEFFSAGPPTSVSRHDMAVLTLAAFARSSKRLSLERCRWLLREAFAPQRRKRKGRDPFTNSMRNMIIWSGVEFIHKEFGLKLTRNRAARSNPSSAPSCCSIVAEALRFMSEDAVWKAYESAANLDAEGRDRIVTLIREISSIMTVEEATALADATPGP